MRRELIPGAAHDFVAVKVGGNPAQCGVMYNPIRAVFTQKACSALSVRSAGECVDQPVKLAAQLEGGDWCGLLVVRHGVMLPTLAR